MLPDPHHTSNTPYLRSCFTYIRLSYDSYVSPPLYFLDPVLYLALFTISHSYLDSDLDPYIYI